MRIFQQVACAALFNLCCLCCAAAFRVVMVEEAAEILEAHVLTSLSPETKHLIMIGGAIVLGAVAAYKLLWACTAYV